MPIPSTPAHHWELMREYHYERWDALDRFWHRYLRNRRHLPFLGFQDAQELPPLFRECLHHAKCEQLAGDKWRSMQAKAKRRGEKQCAS